ncbi:MAG: sugar phosphate isomerase/epimerase [Tannerella sp.]|jgi:sugar phosphate isomerase/epimerase|nr:sugar phosphate isomerase/epimerase [Tannerella sp.]
MKNYSMLKSFLLFAFGAVCLSFSGNMAGKNNSKFGGVQIGTITYSFRSMPDQSLEGILRYSVEAGLSSVELMGTPVERFAGIPQTKDAEEIRSWRTSVSMDKFKEVKKMFKKKGVKIDILKLGDPNWSDEEIDYAFRACKAVGAKGITMEISEKTAQRMAPFAKKYKLPVILHNHGQPGQPGFDFDRILAHGSYLKLNLDVGHYFGATGKNPADLIRRLHNRIASLHIKDKTGPDATPKDTNQPFGQGQTPLAEILKLIQKEKWPITCDIELEYGIPADSDAVKEVKKCVEYCKDILLK